MKTYSKKTLVACGCSHTAGAEIEKTYQPTCYDKAWPRHLSKLLNTESSINLAFSGFSNKAIFRVMQNWVIENVIIQKNYSPDDLVVTIQWTHPGRWELYVPNPGDPEYDDNYPHNRMVSLNANWNFDLDNWSPVTKSELKKFLDYKLRNYNNLAEDFIMLELIVNMEKWLTSLGIENYHANGISGLPGKNYVPDAYSRHPLKKNYLNLLEWYDKRKYHYAFLSHDKTYWRYYEKNEKFGYSSYSEGNHFGEDVHIDWAKKLYEFWFDPTLTEEKKEHYHSNQC